MRFRFLLVSVGSTLAFSALIANLYNLQIDDGTRYAAKAASQDRERGLLEAKRGAIYFTDRNGNRIPAVMNRDYPVVFAVPKEIEDPDAAAQIISKILGLEFIEVKQKLSKHGDSYELLALKVADITAKEVRDANISGIYVTEENFRFYPFQSLAAHVLGFMSPSADDEHPKGRYGIELAFDNELSGISGIADGDRTVAPKHGEDIFLTIDRNIQAHAEDILAKLVEDHGASGGTVIIENPKTGAILTLANAPTFDPNHYGDAPVAYFLNPAVQAIYEPGSVMKTITMAAGIDSGKITPNTTYVDTGSVTLNGKKISNAEGKVYGKITMKEVIEHSVNTGAAFAAKQIGSDLFYEYLEAFGFSRVTRIGLPGEVRGQLASLDERRREVSLATASFGQGIAVTPLQLIAAIGALANDGILMRPRIIASDPEEKVGRPVSPEAAHEVVQMMVNAVDKAKVAAIPSYTVAGKTGTAQVPDFKRGGYTGAFIHTYVGFAPASAPRFIILVKLDKPTNAPLAAQTVVPAFRELAQFLLNYYAIPPDNLPSHEQNP
ncbi:MAG: penicillin-binding protein 2 [Patescibacteria group bacterium]|mgnify:CR=1 FL=1